ncbi:P-loop containing nucleoside triphosphate hydrolase protein [Microdochium trichocladiopsis]|uniref:P-loop containing nucleoside triphosphate hydrolase protein n=1 Tax=Microdochium trichocladiopsis TaxID=1682393 RepID=A0A9P8YDT9_9PEZI|nr:P-loop containing nucleoside triphosphate hydrolase protein [Microdochium trichocladiopsis]KAH7037042.1 P-loop containing nucleoside triphosphate hydrolase protein [Microdochium trichocladiopsis]
MTLTSMSIEAHRPLDAAIPTEDHRKLLDIIDSLRAQGVSRFVALPQIIVCGDQSSGKSSVLEAISGLRFPTRDNLCTRFATELVLRRGTETNTKVFIIPGEDRYDQEEKESLENWRPSVDIDKDGLEAVTEAALKAMGMSGDRRFYSDILRIELSGPTQPHLTMVDLPGLFRTGNKEQSEADVETVCTMVTTYMARERSIILAVVSANYQYVLQEVTSMAQRADPDGLRTMGLITKPDMLDSGSDSESYWVRLAQNAEVELRLGWHVLRNRNYEQRNSTSAERDAVEHKFFSHGIWAGVESSHCGVAALRIRLSSLLKAQIVSQLPSLVKDVEDGISQCSKQLDKLGPSRESTKQQQGYLLSVGEDYTTLMEQSVNGSYTDRFFGNIKKPDDYAKRLRAIVQNSLHEFAQEMRLNGQTRLLTESDATRDNGSPRSEAPRVPRSQYVKDVAERLRKTRGRELLGLFNPLIVGDLFVEQCDPWRRLVRSLVDDIRDAVHTTTRLVIEHVTANDVVTEVVNFVHEQVGELEIELHAKIEELLMSAINQPITYNPQLTENVQKAQQARHKRAIQQQISKIFALREFENTQKTFHVNPVLVVELLAEGLEPDMELFGSSLAVDYMEAYYEVAINRFIDDISVIAIEDCLVKKLSGLFKAKKVLAMTDEEISRLAGETEESVAERKRLEEKKHVLQQALRGLKTLLQHGPINPRGERLYESSSIKPNKLNEASIVSPKAESVASLPTPHSQSHVVESVEDNTKTTEAPPPEGWQVGVPEPPRDAQSILDSTLSTIKKKKKEKKARQVIDDDMNSPWGAVSSLANTPYLTSAQDDEREDF